MLGFMRRYDKSYAYAKNKIEEGAIGKPGLVRCYGLDPAKALPSFLKFATDSYSGGLFLDMAIHYIDLARWYLDSEADELWAIGGAYGHKEFDEINDAETGAAMVKFKNGTNIDLARWYLDSEADELWAIGGAYGHKEFDEINDAETGAAMVKFKNGTMALLVAGRNCAHGYHIETEIIGTEGTLRIGTTPDKNLVTHRN